HVVFGIDVVVHDEGDGRVDDTFRFARRPACIEDNAGIVCFHGFGRTVYRRVGYKIVPPIVSAVSHWDDISGAPDYDHGLDAVEPRYRFVDFLFQWKSISAAEAGIGGDYNLGSIAFQAISQSARRKPGEDGVEQSADPKAR